MIGSDIFIIIKMNSNLCNAQPTLKSQDDETPVFPGAANQQ